MDWYVENCDVSGGHCFMKNHTISEAMNQNSIDYTKIRDVNVPNVSVMEDFGFQDGVCIDSILSASTLNQYANMICSNDSRSPSFYGKILPSKNSSVTKLTSHFVTSRSYEVCSIENTINEKISYSDWSKTQKRAVCRASAVMKSQVKLLAHKT